MSLTGNDFGVPEFTVLLKTLCRHAVGGALDRLLGRLWRYLRRVQQLVAVRERMGRHLSKTGGMRLWCERGIRIGTREYLP